MTSYVSGERTKTRCYQCSFTNSWGQRYVVGIQKVKKSWKWIFRKSVRLTFTRNRPIEFNIIWPHDSCQVILSKNVNSKNPIRASQEILGSNYSNLYMITSAGAYAWPGVGLIEVNIIWSHDTGQVIFSKNVNSKNPIRASQDILR